METKATINDLVGKDLKNFKIIEMTEVYKTDDGGLKISSIGFFKNQNTAEVFASLRTDAVNCKTEKALVLTDDKVGYLLTNKEPITLFDEKEEMPKLKEAILGKLSAQERALIGLGK